MNIKGGYSFEIAGRPSSVIEDVAVPLILTISLKRCGFHLKPIVKSGQSVEFGDILAETDGDVDPIIRIPSPASGTVSFDEEEQPLPSVLRLQDAKPDVLTGKYDHAPVEQITREALCNLLVQGGLWSFFWSSKTRGVPSLAEKEVPRTIVINCLATEPFRTRGRVVLRHGWNEIITGIKFFQRLVSDHGGVEIILTDEHDSIARMMYSDLAGFSGVKFHSVPLRYPIENPRLLNRLIKENNPVYDKEDTLWVIDVQNVKAIGMMLTDGTPLHNRIVAVGGPGCPHPRHVNVRIGTPLRELIGDTLEPDKVLSLRGGLLHGEPIDIATDSVRCDDDAFFFIPKRLHRELLSFVRPGLYRRSAFPAFLSSLLGTPDKEITTSLRGERRPCVACGMCEQVCPVGLLPQVLHRYIYRDALEDVEKAGISLCIDCRLCSYVCLSKIELADQFVKAKEQIREEHIGT